MSNGTDDKKKKIILDGLVAMAAGKGMVDLDSLDEKQITELIEADEEYLLRVSKIWPEFIIE